MSWAPGAIAGVAIGAIFGVLVLSTLVWCFLSGVWDSSSLRRRVLGPKIRAEEERVISDGIGRPADLESGVNDQVDTGPPITEAVWKGETGRWVAGKWRPWSEKPFGGRREGNEGEVIPQ